MWTPGSAAHHVKNALRPRVEVDELIAMDRMAPWL
jgi:hypothetical protein